MKHPILAILGSEEFRTPELERALQLKGWDAKWINPAASGLEADYEGMEPSVLVANSGRIDATIQLARYFRNKNSFIPLILIGENTMGFPISVDAFIQRGANADVWLSALKPFWPDATSLTQQEQELEPEIFGKYKMVRKIASGGTADIFQAEQFEPRGYSRVLAIKRILPQHQKDPIFTKMMFDEANLAALLDHPNIARVMDMGSEAGAYYLAMEYVDGGNLLDLINNAKELEIAFPEPVAAFLIVQAATALDYAHRKRDSEGQTLKLVHRDISPHNILINQEGAVKVIDFGIAKAAALPSDEAQYAAIQGKLPYMSPEQSLGLPIDHRSDIYSLGLVLFEMLTSEQCLQADSEFGLLEKVRAGMVKDIRKIKPSISKTMARILNKALQKDLSNRYGSAQKLARDLGAYLAHLKLASLESDVVTFVKMLNDAQPQTKAFVASHFPPVRGDFALPSEKEKERHKNIPEAEKVKEERPVWILPAINALMILLAYILWLSINR
jgi:serine/threonine protein kinase